MQSFERDYGSAATSLPSDTLAAALKRHFNMEDDDAHAIADVVAEQFGDADEVNDDNLDAEVRSIFYTLEAKKLLSFRREEYSIETGERRRAFFWRLRHDELDRITELSAGTGDESVYDQLPQNAWARTAG